MMERAHMNLTNFLTILAGVYACVMSYASSVATVFVTWTSLGAILGAIAALIGTLKVLYEWRMRVEERRARRRQEAREEAEHRARMRLYTGKEEKDGESC